MEQERLRREEEERLRSNRIELPQRPLGDDEEARSPLGGVAIVDISPQDANTIDL